MARTGIQKGSWVSFGTTTVNTLFGIEGGNVRLLTGSTTGIPFESGVEICAGDNVILPSGLAVSFRTEKDGVAITSTNFG